MSEHPRDLLGAWALGAVDDVERQAVERLIRQDPAVAAEARELIDAMGALAAEAAEEPPENMRERVLTGIAHVRQDHPGERPPHRRRDRQAGPRRHQLRWWAAAAIVLVAVAIPTGIAVHQDGRADRAEQQVQAITAALAEPGAVLIAAPISGGGHAAMVRSHESALVALRDLPVLTDHDYQLWLVQDGATSSAGIINAQDGLATAEVGNAPTETALALTIEPTGGSVQPTTDPVVVLRGP